MSFFCRKRSAYFGLHDNVAFGVDRDKTAGRSRLRFRRKRSAYSGLLFRDRPRHLGPGRMRPTVEVVVAHALVGHCLEVGIEAHMLSGLVGLNTIRVVATSEVSLVRLRATSELGEEHIPDHPQEFHTRLGGGASTLPVAIK